jgi:hypothetical protein
MCGVKHLMYKFKRRNMMLPVYIPSEHMWLLEDENGKIIKVTDEFYRSEFFKWDSIIRTPYKGTDDEI